MNEVLENIKTRRSIRKFKDIPIEKEKLDKIIEAGTYAPSGKNRQSAIIIAITNKQVLEELAEINRQVINLNKKTMYDAPAVLVVLANKDISTYMQDGSAVIENMLLAAHSLDLGSCWVHRAKEEFETEYGKELLKKLGIEGNYEGIGHCLLGYPEEDGILFPRKDNYVYYID